MNDYKKIIKEICEIEKINYKYVSDDYIVILEKNGIYRYLYSYLIGLNSQITGRIIDDKYAMYEILKYHKIPVVKHNLVFHEGIKKTKKNINQKIDFIKKYFINNNHHIVLKPNKGYSGINVYNIKKIDECEIYFKKLLSYTSSIVVNPFYDIKNEHRVIILNNEIRLMYTKNLRNKSWQFNLSKGSYVTKIKNQNLKNKLSNLAIKVYRLINANFVSVDIIEDYRGNFKILEINSSVSMVKYLDQVKEDYEIIKEIYHDAIIDLFKDNS